MVRIFIMLLILCCLSCKENPKAKANYYNLEKVKEGMHFNEVYSIMGNPDETGVLTPNDSIFGLKYFSPRGMSDNFYIYFSKKDSIVIGINRGI
jgi:hypothetical protein